MNKEIPRGGDRQGDSLRSPRREVRPPLEQGTAAKHAGGTPPKELPVVLGRPREDPKLHDLLEQRGRRNTQDQPASATRETHSRNSDVVSRSGDQIRQRDVLPNQEGTFEQGRYPELNGGYVANADRVLANAARVLRNDAVQIANETAAERAPASL